MSEVKQVKVDNWGIFFLQRLKHFFNRTDYCDLTLQFQDNAQLKVHRLVLSACTEYFELLERTCEMYEDCLVMPDDLQADVVVPIVNFMYTGQLEFRMDLLERLYQTSLVMNMPVLTKLLDAHRLRQLVRDTPSNSYTQPKRYKSYDNSRQFSMPSSSNANNNKRSYSKVFDNNTNVQKYRKVSINKSDLEIGDTMPYSNPASLDYRGAAPKTYYSDPRPTRYELPEELESDNLFDNSFANISYTSKPLMVHPETTKHYPSKRSGIFEDPSTFKRFIHGRTTMDIVECKKITENDNIFDEEPSGNICLKQDSNRQQMMSVKGDSRDSNQLFDQILDNGGPKVTIETKDSKQTNNLDHAKIISEVLKKYPHLVKSNKNIKLKILNTPSKRKIRQPTSVEEEKEVKQKIKSENDYTFETDVNDSKEAAKLIALGAENIKGPWICLICAAPGKALHFTSYHKFRRHLVEVHNEKPVLNICEYCGQKAMKRNFLLHHLYTKHGVDPPPQYNFPKCNICNYVALTEGFLIKHKLTHVENQTFRCNVCFTPYATSNQLLTHIQKTGHKYSDKKTNFQCIYCLKVFSRESNLYAHLCTYHKNKSKDDGIIECSDDEKTEIKETEKPNKTPHKQETAKYEVPLSYENDYDDADIQYQIQQQPDGNIQVVSKKPRVLLPTKKHKILNAGLSTPSSKIEQKSKPKNTPFKQNEFVHNSNMSMNTQTEEIVVIDNNEYIVKDNHLVLRKEKSNIRESYSMPEMINTDVEEIKQNINPTPIQYTAVQTINPGDHKMTKTTSTINQPIQIVVSNEEEYKALMASNHSIIFEDADSSKTLTVLTAPDTNAIDLDNTQPNDMMIIQNNYPLNVSEAVAGDNSNIVVVYSHPVDNQNKEFQLITSQNLEAQFVTTSSIITQSYETVTTSAPVMNAQLIETPVDDMNHLLQQNIIPQNIPTDNMEVEVPVNNDEVTISHIETGEGSIDNLQDVQLTANNSTTEEIQQNAAHLNQTNIEHLGADPHVVKNVNETGSVIFSDAQPHVINTCEPQPVFIDAIDTEVTSNMSLDDSNQSVEEKDNTEGANKNVIDEKEKTSEDSMDVETPVIAKKVEIIPSAEEDTVDSVQDSVKEGSTDTETIENISKAIQSSTSISITIPTDTEVHTSIITEPIINRDLSKTQAKAQIQNLTSEWSDDEMESSSQGQEIVQEQRTTKIDTDCDTMETDSQPDMEESIENIQHEMQKQLSRSMQTTTILQDVEPLTAVEENKSEPQDVANPIGDREIETVNKNLVSDESIKAPVKISSLLNDWEDNDSQEDDVPAVADKKDDIEINNSNDPADVIQEVKSIDVIIEPVITKTGTEAKAGENIKSLVSDWADDEE